MDLIGKAQLQEDASKHGDVQGVISSWIEVVEQAEWSNLMDIRATLNRSVDSVEGHTVFNIKGNHYRLIVQIDYELGMVVYEAFLTHSEYDRFQF